jgi:hypothetical protein
LLPYALTFTDPGYRRFFEWVTGLVLNDEEHTITQSLIGLERVEVTDGRLRPSGRAVARRRVWTVGDNDRIDVGGRQACGRQAGRDRPDRPDRLTSRPVDAATRDDVFNRGGDEPAIDRHGCGGFTVPSRNPEDPHQLPYCRSDGCSTRNSPIAK